MRLLFVTPSLPSTHGKGYELMTYHHIEHLSSHHSVDLISYAGRSGDASDLGQLSDWCNQLTTVRLPTWKSLLNVGLGVPFDRPLQVSYYRSRRMAKTIDDHLRETKYDAVVFQLTRMAQYRPPWYQGVTVLNMVDPFVLNYQRSLAWRPRHTRLGLMFETWRLQRYEPKVAPRFDRVLLISEADTKDYKDFLGKANLDWVPYAVDVDTFRPSPEVTRQPGMIVMTGNMFHAPNVDGVEYFCREIFPVVRASVPSATLWLVGARPTARVRSWANEYIKVTGAVPDIKPYLNRAMVSVCPVRLNVGTQTKILEALAMGTPVVTTPAGNNGVRGIDAQHLYVADSPREFAGRVIQLLNGCHWSELSVNGRSLVTEGFTWARSAATLENILNHASDESNER